jgi:hypothetical protein
MSNYTVQLLDGGFLDVTAEMDRIHRSLYALKSVINGLLLREFYGYLSWYHPTFFRHSCSYYGDSNCDAGMMAKKTVQQKKLEASHGKSLANIEYDPPMLSLH